MDCLAQLLLQLGGLLQVLLVQSNSRCLLLHAVNLSLYSKPCIAA